MSGFKLILLIALISLSSCNNKKVTITEEDLNPDIFYLKGEIEPFTGTCYIAFRNSEKIMHKFTYRNGRLQGKAVNYYENGEIKSQGYYSDNKMVDKWEFCNEQGNKIYTVNFQNDSMNGEFISYYLNGNVKEEGAYLNDNKDGKWTYYNQNGEIIDTKNY